MYDKIDFMQDRSRFADPDTGRRHRRSRLLDISVTTGKTRLISPTMNISFEPAINSPRQVQSGTLRAGYRPDWNLCTDADTDPKDSANLDSKRPGACAAGAMLQSRPYGGVQRIYRDIAGEIEWPAEGTWEMGRRDPGGRRRRGERANGRQAARGLQRARRNFATGNYG